MRFLAILLLLVSCASRKPGSIHWKNGEFVENKGTLDEAIHFEEDEYKWKLTLESPRGNKFEYSVKNSNPLVVEGVLDCNPQYEFLPVVSGINKDVRYKRISCGHRTNFDGKFTVITKCEHAGTKSTPVEVETLYTNSKIYLTCQGSR